MSDAVAPWKDFYTLLGAASATLVGLLFVAISISTGVFRDARSPGFRMFLSASVMHFSGTLALALIVLSPVRSWRLLGALVAAAGLVGLGYYAIAWRDAVRDGLVKRIDNEDRVWYAALPVVGYLAEAAAGAALFCGLDAGLIVLAVSAGMLLVIGVHNAWDITVWSTTRTKD